jgi:hypothetical protein
MKEYLVWFGEDGLDDAELIIADSAEEAASKAFDSAFDVTKDFGDLQRTNWVTAQVLRGEDNLYGKYPLETVKIPVDPVEPDCPTNELGKHIWDDDDADVRGHGGGVRVSTLCKNCGLLRVEDTWAQDPVDGEQGLESVEYEWPDEVQDDFSDDEFSDFEGY